MGNLRFGAVQRKELRQNLSVLLTQARHMHHVNGVAELACDVHLDILDVHLLHNKLPLYEQEEKHATIHQ